MVAVPNLLEIVNPRMIARRRIGWPITLATVMIVLLIALAVGWVVLTVRSALSNTNFAGLYWTILAVGSVFLLLVLVGVVLYLVLSIKSINLTNRQSNFIDSVTHELKSPIASLKLYLQTLNRRQVTEEQQADFYRFMLADVERLDHLINHLLDAARLDHDVTVAPVEQIELPQLLRETAKLICLRYHMPPDTIQLDLSSCQVMGRLGDLEIVFRNLMDNALKYAGDPPVVEVQARLINQRQVQVRVSDNGRGIPHNLRSVIFQRFGRLGSELERDRQGTGLGLYIVRTLVKRMGGRIQIRDREQKVGVTFEVHLPGNASSLVPATIETP